MRGQVNLREKLNAVKYSTMKDVGQTGVPSEVKVVCHTTGHLKYSLKQHFSCYCIRPLTFLHAPCVKSAC